MMKFRGVGVLAEAMKPRGAYFDGEAVADFGGRGTRAVLRPDPGIMAYFVRPGGGLRTSGRRGTPGRSEFS
jgi:hypothetical protein